MKRLLLSLLLLVCSVSLAFAQSPTKLCITTNGANCINVDQTFPFPVGNSTSGTTTTLIANGASLSSSINLTASRLVVITMPAAWTAANLTFQISYDCTNYADLYDATGTEYTVTAAASRAILITAADFIGIQCFKIRSGTTGVPVNQAADRTLNLVIMK